MAGFELIKTDDGSWTLKSSLHGEMYHSRHGAIQESKHVFIKNGLHAWLNNNSAPLSILEIGFGTGLNAFLTFLECKELNLHINYTALEAHPVPPEVYQELEYPLLLKVPEHTDLFLRMHSSPWAVAQEIDPLFALEKREISFEEISDKERFDIIYMDAFAPSAQPQFWENPFISQLYASLKQGGLLTTYCAKGSFKRALKEAGFTVVAVPGPPGKREMTTAYKL
jgi:tRNA U34 5-methylaminomethyl-2-thiouridine-forming methyltransferase MnmC